MSQRPVRRLLIWGSAALGLVGIAVGVYDRHAGVPLPQWDLLILVYGSVFLLFLPFDWIGRQTAKFRSDNDALNRGARPRPRPGSAEMRLAVEAPYIRLDEVRLERASEFTASTFQAMLDDAVTELAALENRRPAVDERGHVTTHRIGEWLADAAVYPFLIRYREDLIGVCVARSQGAEVTLEIIYVESAWRQRRIATEALSRMKEFVRLAGSSDEMVAWVSKDNARGRRFLLSVGFRELPHETGAGGHHHFRHEQADASRYVLSLHGTTGSLRDDESV